MHKLVRNGVTAAGLAALLALTGCGSDDKGDSGKGKEEKSTSGGTGAATGGDDKKDDGAAKGGDESVEGSWMSVGGAKPVVLSVKGEQAVLVADGHVCSGTAKSKGKVTLSLTCADGNTDRTMGSVESNDGTSITVSWDAGKSDTLTKTEPGKLPDMSKVPGAGDVPEAGDIPELPQP
ncbi:hypothetical protein [Streptomyces sp. NPDC050504]|uniref:hypothetical protein n=1 Tax=Streptomyces sp. NPDC050504 TaxID=3365618 RepID=UPI00379D2AC6